MVGWGAGGRLTTDEEAAAVDELAVDGALGGDAGGLGEAFEDFAVCVGEEADGVVVLRGVVVVLAEDGAEFCDEVEAGDLEMDEELEERGEQAERGR